MIYTFKRLLDGFLILSYNIIVNNIVLLTTVLYLFTQNSIKYNIVFTFGLDF